MLNTFYDPQIVQGYYNEYLQLIKYYMNVKRPSVFVRYYNIDVDNSTFDKDLETTYDIYTYSDIRFNLYDFTPTFYLAPIVNASANTPDMRGQMMDASSSIVVYTLIPRINDLVMFYGPVKSGEIFRVSNLRTPVNAMYTDANLTWFELDLEYAPISNPAQLKLLNHYVYDLAQEKYIYYTEYQTLIKNISQCEKILNAIVKYYDSYYDLYQANNLVPIEVNEVLIFFKRYFGKKYNRLFEEFFFPYGYLDIFNDKMMYNDYKSLPYVRGNYTYHIYDLVTKKVSPYVWSVTYTDTTDPVKHMFYLSYELLKVFFNWPIEKDILDRNGDQM